MHTVIIKVISWYIWMKSLGNFFCAIQSQFFDLSQSDIMFSQAEYTGFYGGCAIPILVC